MRFLLCLVFSFSVVSVASVLGLEALGFEDMSGASASLAATGYAGNAKIEEGVSMLNPARLGFNKSVSFSANLEYQLTSISTKKSSFSTNSISIPSFYLAFPMGNLGAFSMGLWQRYTSILKYDLKDSVAGNDLKIEYQGSIFEFTPSYALKLPFWYRLSVGGTAHIVMGNNQRSMELGANNSLLNESDVWATNNASITDIAKGSWDILNHPAYYTLSMQYRGKRSNMFFSYTNGHTLINDLEYRFQESELDTLIPSKTSRKIEVPVTVATGISHRFLKEHHLLLDFMWRPWSKSIPTLAGGYALHDSVKVQEEYLLSLGYKKEGSGVFYESYLSRMSYSAGVWHKKHYLRGVKELGASLGLGLPLGRRGTVIDLAFQGGKRSSSSKYHASEAFVGFKLGLMGLSSWGNKY